MRGVGESIGMFHPIITINTNILLRLLTLNAYERWAIIHADRRIVEVGERLLWRSAHRRISFASIAKVIRIDNAVSIELTAGERIHISRAQDPTAARQLAARLDELTGASDRRRERACTTRVSAPRSCDGCRRPSPPGRSSCLYCGGHVAYRHVEVVRGIPIALP